MNVYLKHALTWIKSLASIDMRLVATTLVSIGILHICATLASPHLVEKTAYSRLKATLPINKMKILPPIKPDAQPLPFLSADVRYAMCLFSAKAGPITITAELPDRGWTLSIHTPQGDNIYTATGNTARSSQITLQIVASMSSFSGLTPQSLGLTLSEDPVQTVEAKKGIAILRAPDRGEAYSRNTILAMRKAKCFYAKQ